jgi:lysozyme
MTCTLEEANGWFLSDMAIADSVITRFVSVPLNANQRGALRSFIYNVGQGRASTVTSLGKDGFAVLANGKPSTMLLKLNAGDYQGCADEFLKWTMPGTNVHNGLLARRTAERSLFLKPEDNTGA